MRRDFGLKLSQGFIYDCLRWRIFQLDLAPHCRLVLERFTGTPCVDELHPGCFTPIIATDPVADLPVAFAPVGRNDRGHTRRFLKNLATWVSKPRVVITDSSWLYRAATFRGSRPPPPPVVITDSSSLYRAVPTELWPTARHQLCVLDILKDVIDSILK